MQKRRVRFGRLEYVVFSDGRVWSLSRRRFLSPYIDKDGYRVFRLNGKAVKAHRLVLTVFKRKPVAGEQGRHLDGDTSNNRLLNLRWGTGKQNWADKRRHGRATVGEKHGRAKIKKADAKKIRDAEPSYGYVRKLMAEYGISEARVHQIRRGIGWQ